MALVNSFLTFLSSLTVSPPVRAKREIALPPKKITKTKAMTANSVGPMFLIKFSISLLNIEPLI